MFSFKASTHVPGKIMRFGKAYHGLLKFVSHRTPGYTDERVSYADITLTTRSGKLMPAPLSKGLIARGEFYTSTAMRYGPACIYRHPLAVNQLEGEDGRDFSGYVIFDISGNTIDYMTGYSYESMFAFTPDDLSQGLLVTFYAQAKEVAVYLPVIVGGELSMPPAWRVALPITEAMPIFHASTDGRTIYLGRFPTPIQLVNDVGYEDWKDITPKVAAVALSGVAGDFSATIISINPPPEDVIYRDSHEVIKYDWLSITTPVIRGCYDPPSGADVRIETVTGLATQPTGPGMSIVSLRDEYVMDSRKTCIAAAVVGGGVSYLQLLYEESSMIYGTGSLSASGTVELGDVCGVDDKGKIVAGTSSTVTASHSSESNVKTLISLIGWGGSSTFTADLDGASSGSSTSSVVNGTDGPGSRTSSSEGTYKAILDGQVLLSTSLDGDGAGTLRDISRPQRPSNSAASYGGFIVEMPLYSGPGHYNGAPWAVVTVGIADYQSNDMRAIWVTVEQGRLTSIGADKWGTEEGSYTAKLYIGKTFVRGSIDSYTHSQDLTENAVLFRAYDPVDQKASAVYPHPVAYQ